MTENTREHFAKAVASAISGVHHLYKEVDRLVSGLRDRLAEDPQPLELVKASLMKAGGDGNRFVIRNEYGLLFAPKLDDEADDEDSDEQDGEDEPSRQSGRGLDLSIHPSLLAVRIALHSPRAKGTFEPVFQFAVLRNWHIGDLPLVPDQQGYVAPYMVRRIAKALGTAGQTPGTRMVTDAVYVKQSKGQKSDDRRVGCVLPGGITSVPLFDLGNASDLDGLADNMKAAWAEHSGA